MFVTEREARADPGQFEKKADLLKFGAPHDVAPCIADDFGGSMRVIYAGHFDIPASMISVIFLFASSSLSA